MHKALSQVRGWGVSQAPRPALRPTQLCSHHPHVSGLAGKVKARRRSQTACGQTHPGAGGEAALRMVAHRAQMLPGSQPALLFTCGQGPPQHPRGSEGGTWSARHPPSGRPPGMHTAQKTTTTRRADRQRTSSARSPGERTGKGEPVPCNHPNKTSPAPSAGHGAERPPASGTSPGSRDHSEP